MTSLLQRNVDLFGFFARNVYLVIWKEKIIKIAWWPKRFFVNPTKARTITMGSLIAVFSPVNKLSFELFPSYILFFKLKLQREKNN